MLQRTVLYGRSGSAVAAADVGAKGDAVADAGEPKRAPPAVEELPSEEAGADAGAGAAVEGLPNAPASALGETSWTDAGGAGGAGGGGDVFLAS